MKKLILLAFVLSALTLFISASADTPPQETSVLVVKDNAPVAGTIKGAPVSFIISPGGLEYPVLNPDTAKRLKLGSLPFPIEAVVGPVSIRGKTGMIKFELAGVKSRHRALWFERPIEENADIYIGAYAVPQKIVRFELRPPVEGEKLTSLPMMRSNKLAGINLPLGGQNIFVQFTLNRQKSMASAAAAQVIGKTYGGQLVGPASPTPLEFGVERPVRTLQLSTPLIVGPLSIAELDARISDGGSVSGLPDADKAPVENTDPNEVIVTATKSKVKPDYFMQIGTDALQKCSSLTIDKTRQVIELSCS